MIRKNQIIKDSIKMVSFTCLLIIAISSNANAQEGKKNVLFNMWHLDTYKIEGKEYPPEKKEKGDFILFEEDMTFVSKSEGKQEEGTFILNTNGAYIEMIDKNGEKLKAYIISITKENLILKFDIKEIRDIEVHYSSNI